jgi:hypothetical protein
VLYHQYKGKKENTEAAADWASINDAYIHKIAFEVCDYLTMCWLRDQSVKSFMAKLESGFILSKT